MNNEMTPNSNLLDTDRQAVHDLVLSIADEMTRMQTNLANMDSSVRGYKQLVRSLERMRNHLIVAGYEVVDMMGTPYHEGMRVVATFVFDETLPTGSQIVTAVSKPQVNYLGELIQVAHITVSQNI